MEPNRGIRSGPAHHSGKAGPPHPSRSRCPDPPMASLESVDWDRLLSERETTSAALSAAFQRMLTLEREVEELHQERLVAEGQGRGELVGLREALRQRLRSGLGVGRAAAAAAGIGSSSSSGHAWDGAVTASEALFRNHLEDLRRTADELQSELRLAVEGELALRRSVSARSTALQNFLFRAATAGLQLPQCGPIRLAPSSDAERAALQAAVEEQLHWNLVLRNRSGSSGRRRNSTLRGARAREAGAFAPAQEPG